MDRYLLLIRSYEIRDNATLMLSSIGAASAAAWVIMDKYLPESVKPMLLRTYSVGVLSVYILVLVISVFVGG